MLTEVADEVAESPEDGGGSEARRPGRPKKLDKGARLRRMLRYCRSLPTDHKHYERCQAWLKKSKSTRLRRVRRYCESLPTGHKRYERCQAWLKSQ